MEGNAGASRERILGFLRAAREKRGEAAPAGDLFPPLGRVWPPSGEPAPERRRRFAEALRKVGGEAVDPAGALDARAALHEVADRLRAAEGDGGGKAPLAAMDRDPAWADLAIRGLPVAEILGRAGFEVVEMPAADPGAARSVLAGAALGVTVADRAIADTGTVVQLSRPFRPRAISLLPPVHLVLVPEDRIVGTLEDLLVAESAHFAGPTGYAAFMTGPSRTADIEKVLTIGVHGPGRLVALVLSI